MTRTGKISCIGLYVLLTAVGAFAQVTGSGTPGTVPVFTGSSSIGNSSAPIVVGSNGNVGIGTTAAPNAALQIAGTSYSLSNLSAEKEFSFAFPNTVSNQKLDLYMTGTGGFAGVMTVDVTDNFQWQDATGMISKRFALNFGPNNSIWKNESRYIEDVDATGDSWAISDFSWDATNSRYKITLVHRVSTGNLPSVRIRAFADNSSSIEQFLTFTAGAIYTTDTTTYGRPYVSFNNNVGIGTANPSQALEVNGTVQVDGVLNVGNGGIYFPGNSTPQTQPYTGATCGGDYAESVDVTGDRKKFEPGDVLVIDPGHPGKFLKSAESYSTAVTGIYSTKPGTVGRRQTTPRSPNEVPMAMMGIVPTKVSAENGSIKPGDLLVTSSEIGYAMKGTDRGRMLGAIIGKALGNLESGAGVIEIAVTLQ